MSPYKAFSKESCCTFYSELFSTEYVYVFDMTICVCVRHDIDPTPACSVQIYFYFTHVYTPLIYYLLYDYKFHIAHFLFLGTVHVNVSNLCHLQCCLWLSLTIIL